MTRPVPRLLHTWGCGIRVCSGASCSPEGGGASVPGPLSFEDVPGSACLSPVHVSESSSSPFLEGSCVSSQAADLFRFHVKAL